jgi:hypothetical protein
MNTDAATVTAGDITIDSNHENADQIQLALADEESLETPGSVEATPPETEAAPSASASPAAGETTEVPETPAVELEADADLDATTVAKTRRRNPRAAVQAAVAKQREAERRAEAAEARLESLTQAPSAPTQAGPPPESAPTTPDWARYKAMPAAPKADQFENYDDYTAALATFVTDARQHEYETRREVYFKESAEREAHDAHTAQWQERLAQARADNPDLDDTLDPDVPMSHPMQYLAMESPVGIQLLQYLSANKDDAQRMSTLHPAEVYREMGKLEERLTAAPAPSRGSAQAISHAKPPIQPLGSSPHTPDPMAVTDDLSFEEHFKRMNASDRKHGRL